MYEMTIRLQEDSGKCLYEQIYEHIKSEIREGKLLTDEKLPSTRSLAAHLEVSRSTVDLAYAQLQSEGYIEASPYRGYYVCNVRELFQLERESSHSKEKYTREIMPREIMPQETMPRDTMPRDTMPREIMPQKIIPRDTIPQETEPNHNVLYDFSPNGIDVSGFPLGTWKKITRNVLNSSDSELFSQGHGQGEWELRGTISRYLHSQRGVNCRPEQIIIGAGNDYLLLLLEKILGPQISIAMENPTYKRAYHIFRSFSWHIVMADMDENGMKAEELKKAEVTAAYIMPSHQYPMGTVMPIGRRAELLKWAEGHPDRCLIEDDYDSEFRYRGKPIPSLQASDQSGKVVYIGTFSKAIAPAIRVGYMVLPEYLLDKYLSACSFYSSTVSRIDQRILNEFIRDGYFERHLNKMRKIYRSKHDLLLEALEPFKKDFIISGENAGLHLLLTGKSDRGEAELVSKAAEKGVRVYALSDSLVKPGDNKIGNTVILGYGGLNTEQILKGTELLREAWL